MNIFFLHLNPQICAKYHIDKHIVKMAVEICQMLWVAQHVLRDAPIDPDKVPVKVYRKMSENNPMTIWVRADLKNYMYACRLGIAICEEYTYRYEKKHACQPILEYLMNHPPPAEKFTYVVSESGKCEYAAEEIPDGCTPVPCCVTPESLSHDLVDTYRSYYHTKERFAKWKKRGPPYWWNPRVHAA